MVSRSDPDQFGVIFDRHFDAVHRYLASRVGTDIADDLTSDVFSLAFRRRGSYDSARDDARPWLYGIATNLMRRYHRTEKRRLRAYARGDMAVDQFDDTSAIARVDASVQTASIAAGLALLKPADRDVLLLFAGKEQSDSHYRRVQT